MGLSDLAASSSKVEPTILNLVIRLSETKLEETMEKIRNLLTNQSVAI